VINIKKIEQDERRPSRLMAERLAYSLSVSDGDRSAFLKAALGDRATFRLPLPVDPTFPHTPASISNLPTPSTPFIGRRKELAEASLLLRRHVRLLTLTGVGGVGKSRLALEVAHKLCSYFPEGVFFVPLASLQDPELVISKIAEILKIKENGDQSLQELLRERIYQKAILLLLDNFEQLLPAASLVDELLIHAPGLRLLITSRTPLHLSSEHLMTLQPLSLPHVSPDVSWKEASANIARSDAVRLFVACTRAHSPDFNISETTGPLVAEICQRLDGLPLAIELATAQIHHFSLEMLHSRIQHPLDILTEGFRDFPPRHQGLRTSFEWSYEHLEPVEQLMFPRLGVFSGGFSLEAAELVCRIGETRRTLVGLVDKNMVRCVGDSRYTMIETMREYALERLEIAEEIESTRYAHLVYYTQMAQVAEPYLWGEKQNDWRRRFTADLDNIRAALHWSLERQDATADEIELGARMAGASWYFWYFFGRISEGLRWIEIALQQVTQAGAVRAKLLLAIGALLGHRGDLPTVIKAVRESIDLYRLQQDNIGRAEATHILAHLVFLRQRYRDAEGFFRQGLALYKSLGDQVIVGNIICDLSMVAFYQGDLQTARKYCEESLSLFDQLNAKGQKAQADIRLGDITRQEGDYRKAYDLYQQALSINRELQIPRGIASALNKLGYISLHSGDIHQAQTLFAESLMIRSESGSQQGIAECLAGLACSLTRLSEGERAARFFGAAKGILNRTGLPMIPVDLLEWQRYERKARGLCNATRFQRAWSEGEALNLKQAVELANGDHGS
ncbi:MAG: ATP-binding protein, partial [Acidobacteriaceae bacterium]